MNGLYERGNFIIIIKYLHICFSLCSDFFFKLRLKQDTLKSSFLATFQDSQLRQSTAYSLHQPQGNKEHGTERNGNLYKKSDG